MPEEDGDFEWSDSISIHKSVNLPASSLQIKKCKYNFRFIFSLFKLIGSHYKLLNIT